MNAASAPLNARDQLLARLDDARSVTDDLFRLVRTDALYDRPIPERHRIVFYIGHLEAFDWNLIAGHALGLGVLHKEFDHIFAFGIDPVDGNLPEDKPSDWPRLSEINAYNSHVRQGIDNIIGIHSRAPVSNWQYSLEVILNAAIEHRLMHAETLTYMLHQLSAERKILPRNSGTTSLTNTLCKCQPSRLARIRSRMESSSDLCAKADITIGASGAMRIGPGSKSRR
ncbi:MAG: hypothetical protein ABR906_12745 [Terracidiphilus sp.]